MPKSLIILFSIILLTTFSCKQTKSTMKSGTDNSFQVNAESFADLQVLRYQVPGWEKLTPQQQELAYISTIQDNI